MATNNLKSPELRYGMNVKYTLDFKDSKKKYKILFNFYTDCMYK